MSIDTVDLAKGNMDNIERPREFFPTPERLSQFLEMNIEETESLLATVQGRQQLLEDLREHEADLREVYPQLDFDQLQHRLDLTGEVLTEKKRYLESASDPEKKGIIRRAWESVKGFGKRHPITSAVLLTALTAAAVAAGFYVTGNFELLLTQLGIDKVFAAAGAAEELAPTIAPIENVPNVFEIPTGNPAPGTPGWLDAPM